ncbi:MAG: four helix bundle protein [Planctomycetota bacterium]|jgi:four helix bundle protein
MTFHPKITSFRDLEIWQRSMALVEKIYHVTRSFPKEEMYGLTGQMRRAAVAIPSNIAEGFGRRHNAEYRQFLFIALGSGAELVTQLTISQRLGYIDVAAADPLIDETEQISKMTMSLIKKL